ncbi:MAG: aminotransferase class I/II-fold pyridoxal phosphate-dependent enzyme [Phycisphaerae bacterium]
MDLVPQTTPFKIEIAERMHRLPPYLFGRINKLRHQKRVAGEDIIDLGMGNPTDPTPQSVVDKLTEAAQDPKNHRYALANLGINSLRREVADRYEARHGVKLDPETEVIVTIGSKEGISHMALALLGPGDTAVVPDPAFPIHIYAPTMAGANVFRLPVGTDEAFLHNLERTLDGLFPTPKLVILNFPHNPTSLTVDPAFWEQAVAICRRRGVMILSDFAYGEIAFDGYHPPSVLSVPGAKDLAVEFTTMSKSFNMAGWRVGFCCGNRQMVQALGTLKGYYDYGMFNPIQIASVIAFREAAETPVDQSAFYQARRDEVCRGLDKLGWGYTKPRASMFVWAEVSDEHLKGRDTIDFCIDMLDEAEVALAPGRAFGENGEKFVRIALVENEQRLRQAMRNLDKALNRGGMAKKKTA